MAYLLYANALLETTEQYSLAAQISELLQAAGHVPLLLQTDLRNEATASRVWTDFGMRSAACLILSMDANVPLAEPLQVVNTEMQAQQKPVIVLLWTPIQDFNALVDALGLSARDTLLDFSDAQDRALSLAQLREALQRYEDEAQPAPDGWALVNALLPTAEDGALATDSGYWWAVWGAARLALELGLHRQRGGREANAHEPERLIRWLLSLMQMHHALPPFERAQCGKALGLLGDARVGVGLTSAGIPEIDWVYVEAGAFLFGVPMDERGKYPDDYPESPQEQLMLPAYSISRYPISIQQYEAYLVDTGKPQRNLTRGYIANYPAVNVSWHDAMAFCTWLSAKVGYTVRLPTEAEWQKAARGVNGQTYPYGSLFDSRRANTREMGIGEVVAVGIFPGGASPYGVHDMMGNVWEWCLNRWRMRRAAKATGRLVRYFDSEVTLPEGFAPRVISGGACTTSESLARPTAHYLRAPDYTSAYQGFRVVKDELG